MDLSIGRILNLLDELDLTKNTLVYFISDHGGHIEISGADGQRTGGHNGLFKGGKGMGGMEGGIRVPGILRLPGVIASNSEVKTPTSMLDALPTLLQLCGLPTLQKLLPHYPNVESLDGRSFADLVRRKFSPDKDGMQERFLLHHTGMTVNAVRHITAEKIYKLHLYRPLLKPNNYQCDGGGITLCLAFRGLSQLNDLSDTPLLYELTSDPYEDFPIDANSTEYIHQVNIMKNYLKTHLESNPYPQSEFTMKWRIMFSPWLQPLAKDFSFLKLRY